MGYQTHLEGRFAVTPQLKPEHITYLKEFANTRRMRRTASVAGRIPDPIRKAVGLPIGPDGAYFVGGGGLMGQEHDESVMDGNHPPADQPGLWCKWEPTDDGNFIEWNGHEKFYDYIKWIEYLIANFLTSWGYTLYGTVLWQGEEYGDIGTIDIEDNVVTVYEGRHIDNKRPPREEDEKPIAEQKRPLVFKDPIDEKIDRRAHKEYCRKLQYTAYIDDFLPRDDVPRDSHPWDVRLRDLHKLLQAQLQPLMKPLEGRAGFWWNIYVDFSSRRYEDEPPYNTIVVSVIMKVFADRPKEIFTKEQAIEFCPSKYDLDKALQTAYQLTDEVLTRALQWEADVHTAQRAMDALSEASLDAARSIVRFSQRLAALKAEYKAEAMVQLKRLAAEPGDWKERQPVVDLVRQYVEEFCRHRLASEGNPFASDSDWLKHKLEKNKMDVLS